MSTRSSTSLANRVNKQNFLAALVCAVGSYVRPLGGRYLVIW